MIILQQTRGVLSSGDQLALDLPFAETKSLAARIGPTPTFTRGSGATYVSSDGLLHGVDTSTTSNTIGTGSKTFTLAATAGQDQLYRTGDAVDASNGSNSMVGTVTSYTPSTQVLVCNITSVTGSGTFTSWRIGYRGPRFDHNPVTPFACRGLLIEEGRTNLFQYSEIFNEAASLNYWDSTSANAVTSNQTISPDGAVTADLLTTSAAAFDCFVRRAINWVGSTQYSYSIFLKRGPSNHRYVGLYIGAGITGSVQYPYFDFDNPTTVQIPSGTMVGTINSTRVDAYPNGWYRVSVTFTTAATPVTIFGGVYVATSNGTLPNTPTAGLDCYIWGIQAEAGSFPTSYIPTTTSALARAADVCSITGAAFSGLYNNAAGTLLSEASIANLVGNNRGIVQIDDDLTNNFIRHVYGLTDGGFRSLIRANLDAQTQLSVIAGTASTIQKRVVAYEGTSFASSSNGASVETATRTMPVGLNNIKIGYLFTGLFYLNGHIQSIRYYKKRLPNAKLQALTA